MLYLVTGLPGSGKTLYTVSTLLKKLLSEKIKQKDGTLLDRRLLVDGIPDLLLPHEVLPPLVEDGDKKDVFTCEGDGLLTWPKWCKAGDIIVIDEVQRYWRPRGMGTKPPDMIKALETHRHLGIDFVIITQNPMLIDQNVRRLVGRHQNIRRLFGMARAVVYDWDACSMDVNRTKTATTSMWSYPKDAYKLYSSSVLHLKQRQKIPLWLALPVLAVVGGLFVAPSAFSTMSGAMSGKGVGKTASAPMAPASGAAGSMLAVAALPVAVGPAVSASAPSPAASSAAGLVVPVAAVLAGCISTPKHCGCFDSKGAPFKAEKGFCESHILGNSEPGQKVDLSAVPEFAGRPSDDVEVLAFLAKRRSSE